MELCVLPAFFECLAQKRVKNSNAFKSSRLAIQELFLFIQRNPCNVLNIISFALKTVEPLQFPLLISPSSLPAPQLAPSGTLKFPGIVHGLILNASTPRSHELRRSLKPFPDPESDRVSLEEEFEISSMGRIIQVLQALRHGRPCSTAREGRPSRVVLETISEMPSKSGFEFLVGKNLRTLSKQALISPSPARIRGQHLLLRSFY
nr:hypothetical protein Iba_chr02aCG20950 [Ipomoea batatas]